jgi:hypothetical protein
MEPIFEFKEITILKEDNRNSGPLTEMDFYKWLGNNSKDDIGSILSLKYKADGMDYVFKIERSRIPILNKWDAICTYPKSAGQPVEFAFDWRRGLDFRIDFERKFKEELEKVNQNLNCVCKLQKKVKEIAIGNNEMKRL